MDLATRGAGLQPAQIEPRLTGVFPMLVTPFGADGALLLPDLDRLVDASLSESLTGLAILGLGGESGQLSVSERVRVTDRVLRRVDGMSPVIVGATAQATSDAVALAQHARDAGAAAVMVAPPSSGGTHDALLRHFVAVAKAASPCAIMVQDAPAYVGTSLAAGFAMELAATCGNIRYVKAEGFPILDQVGAVVEAVAAVGLGVFGGNGGLHMLDALAAGASGMIPGCESIADQQAIIADWTSGRVAEAKQRYRRIMPLLAFEMQSLPFFIACSKALLVRRGVLTSPVLRNAPCLGPASQAALFRYADEAIGHGPSTSAITKKGNVMNRLCALSFAFTILASATGGAHAQDPAPVRIGVLDDMAGVYADITGPGGIIAAEMAVEAFGGSVLGRRIEIVGADHQNKSDVGAAIAREWFDKSGVTMITGLGNSAVALAVQEVARQKDRIDIISAGTSTEITGRQCSPGGVQFLLNHYALARGTANAVLKSGGRDWFFLTVDQAFGHSLEKNVSDFVRANGGTVAGAIRHPLNTMDFSSYLLSAQSSGAKVIAFANGGSDVVRSIKQAHEFGLSRDDTLVALLMLITDVDALGLEVAQDLMFTEAFYWDATPETRAWSLKFMARHHRAPTMYQAGNYGAVLHYLKAVAAAGTTESTAVMAKMRELPIDDFFTKGASLRADGQVIRDLYLLRVKRPADSHGPWDYMRIVATIPGAAAFRSLAESECPGIKSVN